MEILGKSLSDVWGPSVRAVLEHGTFIPTENGTSACELTSVLLRIQEPVVNPPLPEGYPESVAYVDLHANTFQPSYDGHAINSRLYKYNGTINQIAAAVDHLRRRWYTRRAVTATWDPVYDPNSARPPCPIVLSFMIREKRLNLTAFLRSNDTWSVAVPDIIGLTRIQKNVADELGMDLGEYCHFSASYHIYKRSYPAAMAIFGRGIRKSD